MTVVIAACLCVAPAILPAQETRIASDFEIAQMERQAAKTKDFASQLSAHLNLGDLHMTRNETAAARADYRKALEIAENERTARRKSGEISKYVTATIFASLAQADLGNERASFDLGEEALRYAADAPRVWNIYANAMSILELREKAAGAARNAVAIAERTQSAPIDLAIFRFALARNVGPDEAIPLLEQIIASLKSKDFDRVRRQIVRSESFEIYSSVSGDPNAYVSILNRSQLRLARLYEDRGDTARARKTYEDVLAGRSDDPNALAGIARLTRSNEERTRYFIDAFDANPFSLDTIHAYQQWLRAGGVIRDDSTSAGAQVRHAVEQISRGEKPSLDALMKEFPNNDTLRYLQDAGSKARATPGFLTGTATTVTPTAEELHALMQLDLTPEQRMALDRITFTSSVTFNAGPPAPAGRTIFESGTIGDVPFRFSEPTAFAGTFGTTARLTYRILGVSADALLLEPAKLEAQ